MSGQITIRLLTEEERDAETGWDEGDLVFVPGTGLTSYNGTSWAPVGAGVDASALVGWTQDGETGVVDTGGQAFNPGDTTVGVTSDDAVVVSSSPEVTVYESGDQILGIGSDGGSAFLILGRGSTGGSPPNDTVSVRIAPDSVQLFDATGTPGAYLTEDALTDFDQLIPASPPEVPATPTAQDIVDALVTLGLITQAAP